MRDPHIGERLAALAHANAVAVYRQARIHHAGAIYAATMWDINVDRDQGSDPLLRGGGGPVATAMKLIMHGRTGAALELLRGGGGPVATGRGHSPAERAALGRIAERLDRKLARPRVSHPMPGLVRGGIEDATTIHAVDNQGHPWRITRADGTVAVTHLRREDVALREDSTATDPTPQAREIVGRLQPKVPTTAATQALLERAARLTSGEDT